MSREQFIELVKSEQERLRRFLLALCLGNRDEADDIAQETLVKAYLSSENYQEEGKFRSWLFRIAHNAFLDRMRHVADDEGLEACRELTDASYTADRDFRYEHLYAAIGLLPGKERTSILLFYMEDYSIREIAKIIDTTEDAVKKQLSRGREHLKQTLKER